MSDAGIVRNRAKIQATIANAEALVSLQEARGDGALDALVWSYARDRPRPASMDEVPAQTAQSRELSRQLRTHGFRFVGPTTGYALMQACGIVDDHIAGCLVPVTRRGMSA